MFIDRKTDTDEFYRIIIIYKYKIIFKQERNYIILILLLVLVTKMC